MGRERMSKWPNIRCDNCIWWKKIADAKGECRANSPIQCVHGYAFEPGSLRPEALFEFNRGAATLVECYQAGANLHPLIRMGWPYTKPDDYCGRFTAIEEEK